MFVEIFLIGDTFLLLGYQALAVGDEKRLEISEEILLGDAQVPVQKEEELAFHEVDLREREAETFESLHCSVTGPMLVLGTGVVQIFGGQDERGEEDAMDSAAHALCDWWQT